MALLAEAFTLGPAPPALPVARLASTPARATRKAPERGVPSALAAAAAVLVASAGKRSRRNSRETVATSVGVLVRTGVRVYASMNLKSGSAAGPFCGRGRGPPELGEAVKAKPLWEARDCRRPSSAAS
eukprot:s6764_g1.t1